MKKLLLLCSIILLFCGSTYAQNLTASWYSIDSLKKEGTFKTSKGVMANGKLFDENKFTCASWDYPLGAKLQITSLGYPKKTVTVENTDRTARRFKGKRCDLSKKAFEILAPLSQGLCEVSIKCVE